MVGAKNPGRLQQQLVALGSGSSWACRRDPGGLPVRQRRINLCRAGAWMLD